MGHMSHFTCYMSHVTCHKSDVTFVFFNFVKLVGGESVIQEAYSRLVLTQTASWPVESLGSDVLLSIILPVCRQGRQEKRRDLEKKTGSVTKFKFL